MKRLLIILSILIVAIITLFLEGGNTKKRRIAPPPEENRDVEMAGPRGEEIFIGSGGGRYFLRDGKKIYVGYKGKKQQVS